MKKNCKKIARKIYFSKTELALSLFRYLFDIQILQPNSICCFC